MDIEYQKTILKNGLRVIVAPLKSTQAVTVLVLVGAGSRYETKEINGLSHVLEHMFFKGTKKRPTALDINIEVNGIGGQNNAFTGDELAGYYVEVPAEYLEVPLDILSDMLKNSVFAEAELNRERGVIMEELRMYLDTPMRHIDDVAISLLFGDQPLGWSTIGTEKVIKKISRQNIVDYLGKQYRPENMLVLISGNLDKTKVVALVEKYFGDLSAGKAAKYLLVKINQKSPAVKIEYKKTDQAHMIISVRTFPRQDERRWALDVLSTILGGNMSSRLFTEVREKRGLCYDIRSYPWEFGDTGALSVQVGLRLGAEKEAVQIILQEFAKMKNKAVPADELKRAKEYIKGTLALRLESSSAIAEFLGEQELLDKEIFNVEEIKKKIDAVNARDLQTLAQTIFVNEGLNLAMIAPYKDEKEYLEILKIS